MSFNVEPGRIVGLIGPNGAGKTTALKAILGLTPFEGELRVLGLDPRSQRDALMREVCFIADVAVLPRWLRVRQALEFVAGVHPRFDRARAEDFLGKTDIRMTSRVRELSKGMVTQLHLALILAIDARLLVLDEPTLGLDLLYRRQFYDTLLNDYFDKERTILLTTHQVEEVENLFTDVIFINRGHVALDASVEELGRRYMQLTVSARRRRRAAARSQPFYEREVFGRVAMFFEGRTPAELGAARRAAHAVDRRPVRRQDAGGAQAMNTTLETAGARALAPAARGFAAGQHAGDAGAARVLGASRRCGLPRWWWRASCMAACIAAILYTHPDLHAADLSWSPPSSAPRRSRARIGRWPSPLYLVAFIVVFFYLLDCLYAERKDRSILFWKSLPVSDGLTVAAKFLVAALAVPLGVYALAAVTDLLFVCFWNLFVTLGGGPQLRIAGTAPPGCGAEWRQLLVVILVSLWYAPICRLPDAVFGMGAAQPVPVGDAAADARAAHRMAELPHSLRVGLHQLSLLWDLADPGARPDAGFRTRPPPGTPRRPSSAAVISAAAFSNIDLWLGVLAAVALLYAAARIRRFRDDT